MESALLLDVVVTQSTAILQLLTSKNQSLLVRWDTLLILDLRLNVVNGVRRLDLQCDGLSSQSLDEDLHTTTQTENQVKSAFLLNVVVGKGATVLELLTSEDQSLLVRWNALLVLNLRLDIVNGIRRLDF